jgi:nitrite reductase (NO-forming)
MFTRRQALLGTAAAALLVAMPPMTATASEADITALPHEKVTLVAPPRSGRG